MSDVDVVVIGPCPGCGVVAGRTTYDIGSGPELACSSCELCWGAEGQHLAPIDGRAVLAKLRRLHANLVAGLEDTPDD